MPVGSSLQLAAAGAYSDGSKAVLTSSAVWTTSDGKVATVDANGLVTGVANGTVTITATSGSVTGKTSLSSRVMATLAAGSALPAAVTVDTSQKFFRITGLTPGAVYEPTLDKMSDDVDSARLRGSVRGRDGAALRFAAGRHRGGGVRRAGERQR